MSTAPVDEIDRAILYHLQEDGRRSITDIATDLDVSDNTVRNRIQRMEEAGIITGYTVKVDYDAAGIQHHYVFVCTARVSEREELAAEVRKLPGVIEVLTLMTGTDNVFVIAVTSRKDEITDLAYAIDELGLRIEREHLIREHTRQPYSELRPPEYLSRK